MTREKAIVWRCIGNDELSLTCMMTRSWWIYAGVARDSAGAIWAHNLSDLRTSGRWIRPELGEKEDYEDDRIDYGDA